MEDGMNHMREWDKQTEYSRYIKALLRKGFVDKNKINYASAYFDPGGSAFVRRLKAPLL
jgi:predicted transcriptional regulator